ncbi:retrovirus-related pol polyprotein from transposon TNT 1-94 [Tanacetum coccineum]
MLLALGETIQADRQGLLNATTVKVKDIWLDNALSLSDQGMQHDPGVPDGQVVQTVIPNTVAFHTEDLDTYDSDCDDILNAQAVLMANISNYGSNVISKVPPFDTYLNDMENQSVHAMQDFEQTPAVDFIDNEIHMGQSAQAVHMLTKPQAFYDNIHKQALGYQNSFHLKKAQRIKPTLYDGIVMSDKHVAMPVIDAEETLILEEESRSKMSEKKQRIQRDLLNEIMEVKTVFDQMDVAVQQSSVDKQCLEIAKKELLLKNDQLLQQIMSQDVFLTVMNFMSLIGETVNMDGKRNKTCDKCFNLEAKLLKSQNAFNDLVKQFFANNDLKDQLQDKDSTIYKELDFACKHARRIQELLVYVRDTCPNAINLTAKKVVGTPKNKDKKVRSKPTGNKRNDRISQTPSRNMKNKVEAQPRKKSLFDDVHDKCFPDCSLVSRLQMFETHDREPLSAHELYAPSTSIPSTQEQEHSSTISQGFEESPKTPNFLNDPLNESPHEESTSQGSSSNVRQTHTPFEHLGKWTKDHPIANVIDDPSYSVSTRKQLQTDAMWCFFDAFLTSVEPKNFKQAMTKPSWIDAMQEEIYEFLKRPNEFGNDEFDGVLKNKARLVAQGFRQEEGIDFEESLHQSYARIEAIRIFIANAPSVEYDYLLIDVKTTAFLEWQAQRICQASYLNNISPESLVMNPITTSHVKKRNDLLLEYKVFPPKQIPRGIIINQIEHMPISEIVKKYGMLTTDSVDTPLVEKSKLDEDLQGKQVDATLYHGMIGSFMYLTSSRPDLIHAVCLCARYQAKPTEKHLQAVKRIFRYLKGTINIGLWYSKDTGMSLTAYADADHAGCQDTRCGAYRERSFL